MFKAASMLMVGGGDRGSGKTTFACSVIEEFRGRCEIVGVKVTAVNDGESGCPRGEGGCAVCGALKSDYEIIEEKESGGEKDTCKMLAAGAKRVFWLRVFRSHLEAGAGALLEALGEEAVTVCESNSLRGVVEPGVFVMTKSRGEGEVKPSAEEVVAYADRVVRFDGEEFDVGLSDISIVDGRWAIRGEAGAIVLAGGASVRMGEDKSMLDIGGEPMIKYVVEQLRPHFSQVLISGGDVEKYGFVGVEVVGDREAGRGPLMGIASALRVSVNELNFVTACDIPEVDMSFVKEMVRECRGYDAVVPRSEASRYEPLFAVYNKSALGGIEAALAKGENRIMDALGGCKVKYIDISERGGAVLKNINTMSEYLKFVGKEKDDTV